MTPGKFNRIVVSLAASGILIAVLFFCFHLTSQSALASSSVLFITPTGSGDCSQSNPCSLQTALNQAEDGDNLYLAQGTYTGSGGAVITLTKSIGLYGGWDGSATTPIVRDPLVYPTTLDGEDTRQVINISGNITPTVEGFVITRGRGAYGGGIYITGAPIIRNNVITDNHVIDDPLNDNDGQGGGIYISGGRHTLITQNHIYNNTGGIGAGIYHYGYKVTYPISITMNEIVGNIASYEGGGIRSSAAPDLIASNIISGNVAGEGGGGLLLRQSPAQVQGNYVMNNQADYGAGVYIDYHSTLNLVNNLLVNNDEDGIYVEASNPVIVNNTIVSRFVNFGYGIYISSLPDCEPDNCSSGNYVNNIVVKYDYGIGGSGAITPTIDYNDVWGSVIGNFSLPAGVVTGTHNISQNPSFVNTKIADYHLQPGSPCNNAGDPAGVPPAPSTDIDGQPRPSAGRVDIGADEIWYSLFLPFIIK